MTTTINGSKQAFIIDPKNYILEIVLAICYIVLISIKNEITNIIVKRAGNLPGSFACKNNLSKRVYINKS